MSKSPPYVVQPDFRVPPHQMMQAPINYGPEPQSCICPHCHANIITDVKLEATTKTHGMALLLCCCLCWPCAWLPYCMDSCQSKNHHCPNCQAFLGNHSS